MPWIEDFIKLNFPIFGSELRIQEAHALKHKNLPEAIYQYHPYEEARIETFEQNSIWLSDPSKFNDPFDCAINVDFSQVGKNKWLENMTPEARSSHGITDALLKQAKASEDPLTFLTNWLVENGKMTAAAAVAVKKAIVEVSEKNYEQMRQKWFYQNHKTTKVSCFSTHPDLFLMWSYYTRGHTGFCLRYEPKPFSVDDIRVRMLYPVIYSDIPFDMTGYLSTGRENPAVPLNILYSIQGVITKSSEWKHENEWRFVASGGVVPNASRFGFIPATAIYLGFGLDTNARKRLIGIAKHKKLRIFEMKLSKTVYKLEATEIPNSN